MKNFLRFFGVFLLGSPLYAAYSMDPVQLVFPVGKQIIPLNFSYEKEKDEPVSKEPKHFEVLLYSWGHELKDSMTIDKLTPSQDLIISPSIFSVTQGKSQTIRLALKKQVNNDFSQEKFYRVVIKEVRSTATKEQINAVRWVFHFSLPLVIEPKQKNAALPKCVARAQQSNKSIAVKCTNEGNIHQKILKATWKDKQGKEQNQELAKYVFPGKEHILSLPLKDGLQYNNPINLHFSVDKKQHTVSISPN